jgi:Na+/proline symporter
MSCSRYTPGADCDTVYVLPGVTQARANEIFALGKTLGLTEFNPTVVNWDIPYEWKSAEEGSGVIMSQGLGYFMLIGAGVVFSILVIALTYFERVFAGVQATSEHFNTAGREVKTGLTASVIVSQWTWAATLLQSSNVAWQYGVTGPFWYASGASIQVLCFGILAIEVKRKAPNAHTFLEMILVRWGKCAHFTFVFFGLSTCLIVSSMLLLGGCAVMKDAAGIPIPVSSILIPASTLVYTLFGGLKATFLASYIHTTVIFIGLILFVTLVYGYESDCTDTTVQCNSLGSASVMWERLRFVNSLPIRVTDDAHPDGMHTYFDGTSNVTSRGFHQGPAFPSRDGNREGTYLTMMSLPGVLFGIINIVGNFGTVFVDQSYWQSAIAASPASAHKGYLLGGLVWFTIPFALATSLGLAGNALNVALTPNDAGAGLVPPASAHALGGAPLAIWMILMLLMAIVSTGSAECIAVSSLWSYDIYRTYLNPSATGKQILLHSRIVCIVWAVVMCLASIILWQISESDSNGCLHLGWVYNFMGISIGSAVPPIAMVLTTNKLSANFAILGAFGGFFAALTAWIVVAVQQASIVGSPSAICALGTLYAQLAGNCVAIGFSTIVCAIGCLIAPQNFDWAIMKDGIKLVGGDGGENAKTLGADWESRPEFLDEAQAWIYKYGIRWTLFLIVGWPTIMIPFGAFGKSSFQLWGAVALCWGWTAGLTIILLPLLENSKYIIKVITCNKHAGESAAEKPVETATA